MANVYQAQRPRAFRLACTASRCHRLRPTDGSIEKREDVRAGEREQSLRTMIQSGIDRVIAAMARFG